jgi:hypothetical protein
MVQRPTTLLRADWSSNHGDLVVHESRRVLSRLRLADFDVAARHVVAQPFLIAATVEGGDAGVFDSIKTN